MRPRIWTVLGAVFLVFAAGALTLTFPPQPLLQSVARQGLDPSIRWTRILREGVAPVMEGVECPARPAGFKADRVLLTHSILQGIWTGEWSFRFVNLELVPADPRWPALPFESGEGVWSARMKKLQLRNCVSKYALIDADLAWDGSNRMSAVRIQGSANPRELGGALAAWKALKLEPASTERLPFLLTYEKGSLQIFVNHKPFFKASWRSNGAF